MDPTEAGPSEPSEQETTRSCALLAAGTFAGERLRLHPRLVALHVAVATSVERAGTVDTHRVLA